MLAGRQADDQAVEIVRQLDLAREARLVRHLIGEIQHGLLHVGLLGDLVGEGVLWVKLTPYRPSTDYPQYRDVQPLHKHLLNINPERLLWGSDWPHINMERDVPDAGHLLDLLHDWTPDAHQLQRILVDNPAALYGF